MYASTAEGPQHLRIAWARVSSVATGGGSVCVDWLAMRGALMKSCDGARRKLRYVVWFVRLRTTGPGGEVILRTRYWLLSRRWTTSPTRTLWVRPSQVVKGAKGRLKKSKGDPQRSRREEAAKLAKRVRRWTSVRKLLSLQKGSSLRTTELKNVKGTKQAN